MAPNVLWHMAGLRSKVRIVCISKQTANECCWLYICAVVPKISAMRSTNSCYTTIVLMLISAEVMLAPIFGAKILFLPLNVDSHVQYFSRLAADLAQLGHVTRVLAPSNARVPHFVGEAESGVNFSYVTHQVDGEESYINSREVSEACMRFAASRSFWEKLAVWSDTQKNRTDHFESDCVRLLENDHIMKQVRDEGYQFAVIDGLGTPCYYAIPYSLEVPYATLSAPINPRAYRVPRFPSFSPSLRFTFSDRMSFVERLTTFVFDQLIFIQLQNDTTTYVDRLAPGRRSLNNIQLLQRVPFKYLFLS